MKSADQFEREVAAEEAAASSGLNSAGRPGGVVSFTRPSAPGNESQYIPITPGVGFTPTADMQQNLIGRGIQPQPTWVPANVADSRLFYAGGYYSGQAGRAYAAELEAWAKTISVNSSGNTLWEEAVKLSEFEADMGRVVPPYTFVEAWAADGGGVRDLFQSSGGGSGYYGGGGGGSSTSINLTNREDARAVIDQLAISMIGRTVDDKEFEKYYQVLTSAERANPTTVAMEGGTVVQQSGLGSSGRQAILEQALRENEDFADFQMGSQMIGMFQRYLQEREVFSG